MEFKRSEYDTVHVYGNKSLRKPRLKGECGIPRKKRVDKIKMDLKGRGLSIVSLFSLRVISLYPYVNIAKPQGSSTKLTVLF
jgi:hypothetical protein